MQECDFNRWDIKGSGKPKRSLKLAQQSTQSNKAKLPAATPHWQSLAAPMDKQLRNKSALFVFTEVRNTSKPGNDFSFFRQLAHSKQQAGMGRREGRATTPSILFLVHGVDCTAQRGPAPHISFVSGLTSSDQDTPLWVPDVLHPAWK